MDKSLLLGINTEENNTSNLEKTIGCAAGVWPIRYLGIPLGDNPLKISKQMLDGKKAYLSRGLGT